MTLDDIFELHDERKRQHICEIFRDALQTPAGEKMLAVLMKGVSPFAPSVYEGNNDPHTVGLREGRREFSAFLLRMSGKAPAV